MWYHCYEQRKRKFQQTFTANVTETLAVLLFSVASQSHELAGAVSIQQHQLPPAEQHCIGKLSVVCAGGKWRI
jgi:hypothetical protein